MQLNDTQQKLAADNYQLMYGFLQTYNLDEEEYLDLLMIGLCKAAGTFDAERGYQFSSYAFSCMLNEVRRQKRAEASLSRIPPYMVVSYDESIPNQDDDEELTFKDNIVDDNADKYISAGLFANEMINALTDKEKEIVAYLDLGYSQKEISTIFGVSRSRISSIVNQIRDKMKPFLVH